MEATLVQILRIPAHLPVLPIDNVSTAKILPWCAFFVHTTINFIRTEISDRLPTGNGICFTFADDVSILHAARSILDTI